MTEEQRQKGGLVPSQQQVSPIYSWFLTCVWGNVLLRQTSPSIHPLLFYFLEETSTVFCHCQCYFQVSESSNGLMPWEVFSSFIPSWISISSVWSIMFILAEVLPSYLPLKHRHAFSMFQVLKSVTEQRGENRRKGKNKSWFVPLGKSFIFCSKRVSYLRYLPIPDVSVGGLILPSHPQWT